MFFKHILEAKCKHRKKPLKILFTLPVINFTSTPKNLLVKKLFNFWVAPMKNFFRIDSEREKRGLC